MVSRAILNGWPLIAGQKTGAAAPVSLNALSLSITTGTVGSPFSATISGGTTGSAITLTGAGAAGLTVSGSSVTGTPTTVGAVNLVETFGAAINSPRTSSGVLTVSAAAVTLGPLSLSVTTATAGTAYTATISGKTSGSTITVSGTGSSGLSVSGTTLSGTPSTAGSVDLVETLAGATNTPRTSSGALTVAASGSVTLNALTLAPNTGNVSSAYSGTVTGKTSGSTLSLSGAGAAGLSVTGSTVSGTPTTVGAVNIVETLAGATDTPRTSSAVLSIAAAAGDTTPNAFTLAQTNNAPALTQQTQTPSPALTGYDTPIPFSFAGGLKISVDGGATFSSIGNVPVGVNPIFAVNSGPAGSTLTINDNLGGTAFTWTIVSQAAAGATTPLTIATTRVIAWFDDTDPATMFQDVAMTTPIVPGGTSTQRTVAAQKAKTYANPNGDSSWIRSQSDSTRRPLYSPTGYNGGSSAGLTFASGQFFVTRNKSIGGGNTLSGLVAVNEVSGGGQGAILAFVKADIRAGQSGANAGGMLFRDGGSGASGYMDFGNGSQGAGQDSPSGVTQNYEIAADSGTYRIYRAGVQLASATVANTYDNPLDISYWNNGAYNNDGVTPSQPTSGAVGSEQHVLILSSPLATGERSNMQTYLAASSGGTNYAVSGLKQTTTTGSMASGGSVLTVASGTGWVNGDPIIVEPTTGYGTIGPGGVWPNQSAANEAAILALTYSNPDRRIRAADTGKVYRPRIDKAAFTGSRSGTTMTVTAMLANETGSVQPIRLGGRITGGSSIYEDYIEEQLTGTPGGVGTYRTTDNYSLSSRNFGLVGGGGYYDWSASQGGYYDRYCIPRALVTTVVSGGGSTALTLAAPSQVAVTTAGVKFNNRPAIETALNGPDGATFTFPAGTFWIDRGVVCPSKNKWTVKGLGKGVGGTEIRSARSCPATFFAFLGCVQPTLQDIRLTGNHGYDGVAGLDFSTTDPNRINGYGDAVTFDVGSGPLMQDVLIVDYVQSSHVFRDIGSDGGRSLPSTDGSGINNYGMMIDCESRLTQANQSYTQWPYEIVTSTNIELVRCKTTNVFVGCGLEAFGSKNTRMTDCTMRNGLYSINSAEQTSLIRSTQTFSDLCRDMTMLNPIIASCMGINTNAFNISGVGNAGVGGKCINSSVLLEGWWDASGYVPKLISVDGSGWDFVGTYDPTVKDDGLRKGLLRAPSSKVGFVAGPSGSTTFGGGEGPALISAFNGTTVTGIRVMQLDTTAYPNQRAWPGNGSAQCITMYNATDCYVHKTITGGSSPDLPSNLTATQAPTTGADKNISNAAYAALP